MTNLAAGYTSVGSTPSTSVVGKSVLDRSYFRRGAIPINQGERASIQRGPGRAAASSMTPPPELPRSPFVYPHPMRPAIPEHSCVDIRRK